MAAAAVLPDREMDKRGQARGRRRKREEARSALSNSISIGLHGGWPAVRARNPLEIRIYAPRDRMSRAEIVRDSVCQRASSSTRHREPGEYVHRYWTRQSMSAITDPLHPSPRSLVFHPVAWLMIQSETLPDRIETRARTPLSYSINWLPPIKFRSRETFRCFEDRDSFLLFSGGIV